MNFFDVKPYVKKFNDLLVLRDLTYNTVKSYNSMLRSYLSWVSAHQKTPEAMTFDEVRDYLLYLKKSKGLCNHSINAHVSQLRFFHLYVLGKSWNKYEVPFMKVHTLLPDILTVEEAHEFIHTIPNLKEQACVALLYASGLRISELCHLRYEDIRRQEKRIYVRPSKSRSDRYAILSESALAILTKYWFAYDRPKGWLFPGTKPDSPMVSFTASTYISNHVQRLNWKKKPTAHTFRHSFGTHLYEQGYDLLTIQKLLGHKSANSSLIYVHLAARTIKQLKSPFDREGDR